MRTGGYVRMLAGVKRVCLCARVSFLDWQLPLSPLPDLILILARSGLQGLTIGSMWYDSETNGSWAMAPHRASPMLHAFH